jgi:hypothetical protein
VHVAFLSCAWCTLREGRASSHSVFFPCAQRTRPCRFDTADRVRGDNIKVIPSVVQRAIVAVRRVHD